MTWRTEVIESMPLRVKISVPELAERVRPNMKSYERRGIISRVYGALRTEEPYGTIVCLGEGIDSRGKKAILWMKLQ